MHFLDYYLCNTIGHSLESYSETQQFRVSKETKVEKQNCISCSTNYSSLL